MLVVIARIVQVMRSTADSFWTPVTLLQSLA